jgi:hypothetical protein
MDESQESVADPGGVHKLQDLIRIFNWASHPIAVSTRTAELSAELGYSLELSERLVGKMIDWVEK